jgi:hydrogenase maturation protease
MRIHVIGIGSRHGDDAAGLRVADALCSAPLPEHVSIHLCERPLPDLLDALESADAAVLVDAARSGAVPGCVRRVAPDELATISSASSHGLGVAHALALARDLGRAPRRIEVVAIEIGDRGAEDLTPPVARAVPRAVEVVLEILHEFSALDAGACCDA